ncbi:MAG: recombinase family protein [Lysobacter sp.]
MRALGYIRVSTDEQAGSGHSMAMQPQRIRQWCDLHDFQLVDLIRDDGVSAGIALERRKGGAELLRRLRDGEADVVVVYKLDRLFRDSLDGLQFFRDIAAGPGIAVHSITELIDTSTPAGQLNLTIQLGLAQYERQVTAERNRAVSAHLRKQGRVYGTVPYGCIEVDGNLYQHPDTWAQRERIVTLARTPARGRRLSLSQLAMTLRELGIPAPRGGSEWSKTSVSRVVSTHDELNHIPPFPADHEAAVSEAACA